MIDDNMKIRDLKKCIFDLVVIYTKDPHKLDCWIDLYKGYLTDADEEILELEVGTIGAKRTRIVDIRVE